MSERRELLLFRAIRYPALLLARGLCYTFLINYKLLQIYLQAGITFIPPPSLPYTPHCLLVCISVVRLKSPVCVCVCVFAQSFLPPLQSLPPPLLLHSLAACVCMCVCLGILYSLLKSRFAHLLKVVLKAIASTPHPFVPSLCTRPHSVKHLKLTASGGGGRGDCSLQLVTCNFIFINCRLPLSRNTPHLHPLGFHRF